MQADILIEKHRLLAILLARWEAQQGRIGPGGHIRLQRLWSALPEGVDFRELCHLLCPVFVTEPHRQEEFYTLFDQLVGELGLLTNTKPAPRRDSNADKDRTDEMTETPVTAGSSKTSNPSTATSSRPLIAELDNCTDPPFSWNLIPKDEEEQTLAIDLGEGFGKTALQLRRREAVSGDVLNMPATIHASIRRAGLLDLRYLQRTRLPEYLLLVDRFSQNDHRTGVFDFVYHTLRQKEVLAERFFYDGDLRICRNEDHPAGLSLPELRYRYPNARLLVFGSGYRMISNRTAHLAEWTSLLTYWPIRILLTSVPHSQWGHNEQQLEQIFTLLPAAVQSLQYIAEAHSLAAVHQYETLPDFVRLMAETAPLQLEAPIMLSLHEHFNADMLCWIAACAIYPALHYSLTLRIGHLLSDTMGHNLVTADNLLALARLPWFAEGKIPSQYRNELLGYLEHRHPQQHLKILNYLRQLMEENPPPTGSVAWADHQINLALINTKIDATPDEQTAQVLHTIVKRLNRPVQPGDFVLPEHWETLLERIGLPATEPPVLLLVYREIHQLLETKDDASYNRVENILTEHAANLDTVDLHGALKHLYNYAAIQIRNGREEFFSKKLHHLNQISLQYGFFTEKGIMTARAFANIVNVACAANDILWASAFVSEQSYLLPDELREATVKLSTAIIAFEKKDFMAVLPLLNGLKFSDLHANMRLRALVLKTYYETGADFEQIFKYCAAFEALLRRNRKPQTDSVEATLAFVLIVKMLLMQNTSKAALVKRINESTNLYFRTWLRKKTDDYRSF